VTQVALYLALDYGEKRIGVACSDESGIIAEAVGFIHAVPHDKMLQNIADMARSRGVSTIVVGLPRTMRGEIGLAAEKVGGFVEALRRVSDCEVLTWDERLTTQAADRTFRDAGYTPSRRKWKRDAMAAQLLLQNYLDYLRRGQTHVSTDETE
jgi:putative Holliday junction resolvase